MLAKLSVALGRLRFTRSRLRPRLSTSLSASPACLPACLLLPACRLRVPWLRGYLYVSSTWARLRCSVERENWKEGNARCTTETEECERRGSESAIRRGTLRRARTNAFVSAGGSPNRSLRLPRLTAPVLSTRGDRDGHMAAAPPVLSLRLLYASSKRGVPIDISPNYMRAARRFNIHAKNIGESFKNRIISFVRALSTSPSRFRVGEKIFRVYAERTRARVIVITYRALRQDAALINRYRPREPLRDQRPFYSFQKRGEEAD